MTSKLGTILPTKKSLKINDNFAIKNELTVQRVGIQKLSDMPAKRVNGETRYYKTQTVYAIVGQRDHKIKWFETREDGDYAI